MNAERWRRITETFDSALEHSPEVRHSYLAKSCGDDEDLRGEVARLLAEFEKAGDFLEKPLIGPGQTLATGELVATRYRIEALVGRGGMGEVYRAHDELLGEPVALKTLRREFTGNPSVLRRFQREVQLARKVTHPNVCRVFDVGTHGAADRPLHFFTMELLDGETLAARIHSAGPMTREEAFPLILQMADGLHAAHQAGIVHRDFKSSNVMLCGEPANPRAVITDFGLARLDAAVITRETPGTITTNAQVAGTVAYMSPEQLSGAPVTTASDIYSLGIVLFEMATAQLPFEGSQIIKSAMQRATGSVVDVRAHIKRIDPRWESAITRCLQRDPAHRFPTAVALSTHFRQWRPHPAYWTRRQWVRAGAVAAAIPAVGVSLSYVIPRLRYRDLKAGAKIMMAPTVNATGEERFNGLATALRTSVGQSARFNLWDNHRLAPVLQSMRREPNSKPSGENWREIAFREGSPFVVFSTLSSVADGYSLTLHAEQIGAAPDPPMRTWNHTVSASSPNAVFEAIHTAASWVRTTAGETPTELSAHNRLPQDITSSSWEALQLYDQAQQLIQTGKPAQGVPFLRRAVGLDRHFAMAFMRLGDVLIAQRDAEGYLFWDAALKEGREHHLSEHERVTIEARAGLERGDYSIAEAALLEWASRFPFDSRPVEYLVPCLVSLGRFPEAIEMARSSRKKFGPSMFVTGHLIHALGLTNRLDEIPGEIGRLNSEGSIPEAFAFRGILHAVQGRREQAERAFLEYGQAGGHAARVASFLAHLAADSGDFEAAAGILREALDQDLHTGNAGLAASKSASLAFLESQMGRRNRARAYALTAASYGGTVLALAQAATILARENFLRDALRVAKQLRSGEGATREFSRLRIEGELLLAQGLKSQGLALLERANGFDSQSHANEYLAHALVAAGQLERARLVYAEMERRPWRTWTAVESEWPGLRFIARRFLNH